jgi:hypothetical protein
MADHGRTSKAMCKLHCPSRNLKAVSATASWSFNLPRSRSFIFNRQTEAGRGDSGLFRLLPSFGLVHSFQKAESAPLTIDHTAIVEYVFKLGETT